MSALFGNDFPCCTTTPEDTAVSHVDEPQPPIPAEGAPHAYIAVRRIFPASADRPQWAYPAYAIPEWNHKQLDYFRQRGFDLLPIGPGGDTGTRAIVEPRRITTSADLDALTRGSVILLDYDVILQAVLDWEDVEDPSCWRGVGEGAPILTSSQVIEAAGKGATITVLHTPTEVTS